MAIATPTAPSTRATRAHEREQAGGTVEGFRERWVGFAVVGDLGVGQQSFELGLEGGYVCIGERLAGFGRRQLEEIAARGPRAGSDQTGGGERRLREKHARTGGEGAGETIRLVLDDGDDAKDLGAELDGIADVEVQAHEEVFANGDAWSL